MTQLTELVFKLTRTRNGRSASDTVSIRVRAASVPAVTRTPRTVALGTPSASDASGVLAGALSVDQTGSAGYTIPITVPPGTAGMQPSLSLSYNSSGGNGMLGQGWTLQGLSTISRCPKTKAQDGAHGTIRYDSNDRFCLDGQRLVAVRGTYGRSGTEYRTEIDSFVKVISRGTAGSGPQYWEAWTKSGQRMEYGRTTSSRVEATGQSSVRQWRLNRVQDTVGNYLTVSYAEDRADGFAYPSRIDYGGHRQGSAVQAPYASVRFGYGTRHDAIVLMQGGYRVRVDRRLTAVRTYVNETLVSNYRLSYSSTGLPYPSRVTSVRHCDGVGDCLPGVSLTWNGLGQGRVVSTGENYSLGNYPVIGDFNGDGRVSFTRANAPSGYAGYSPLVGDYDGDGDSDIAWVKASSSGLSFYLNGSVRTVRSGNRDGYAPQVGDFDGDGRADVVWTKADSRGMRAFVALRNSSGIGNATYTSVKSSGNYSGYEAQVGDFDGDGLADLAWSRAYNGGIKAYVTLGNGAGEFGPAVSTPVKTGGNYTGYKAHVADFNGDGISDLVWMKGLNGGLRAYAVLGEGDGGFASVQQSNPRTSGNYPNYDPVVGDFNGDGLADLAWAEKSGSSRNAYVSMGDGTGRFRTARYSQNGSPINNLSGTYINPRISDTQAPITGDFNGDGISDIAWRSQVSYTYVWKGPVNYDCRRRQGGECRSIERRSATLWMAHHAESEVPEDYGKISRIAPGNGTAFGLDYASLSDPVSKIYWKDSSTFRCRLPCQDIQAPIYVVKEVAKNHGSGLTERITYTYGGAKADLAGRGFKGFGWISSTDTRTGIVSQTVYKQDFPYIGQVASSSRYVVGSPTTRLGTEANTWTSRSLNGGRTRFPYISSSTARTYELEDGANNRAVTTVTNSSVYDSYGNPTSITVMTTGAGGTFRKTTTNTYTNTTSSWHLGRLTCATVRSEAPGEAAATRTSGFAYDAATGLLTKEVIEPGSGDIAGCVSALPASELEAITLTTTYRHDRHGNRRQATTAGAGVAPRTSTTAWGERASCGAVTSNGRFPVSVRNALGHAAENWHSGAFGTLLQSRDANGLVTRTEYDSFGRAIRTVQADGSQQAVQYRNCGRAGLNCPSRAVRAVLTDRTGSASVIRYLDRRGLVVRTETEGFDGAAVYQDTMYDAAGQAIQKSRAYQAGETVRWSRYVYDRLGRVKGETLPNGSVTTTNYDGLAGGRIRERVHARASATAAARTTIRESDALGRTVRTTDPSGNVTSFAYTESGKRRKVTAANGSVTTRTFDLRGRLLSQTDPDRGTQTYRYNALGELVSQTSARGQTVTFRYDLLGRLVRRAEPEGTTVWAYDATATGKGRLAQVSGPNGYLRTHTYDAYGRPSGETATIGGETFASSRTYDAAGRVATLTYPTSGLVVRHEYTATGYLEKVRKNASCGTVYWTAQAVNADGQVEESLLGNGVGTTRVYDPKTGLVRSIQSGLGGGSAVQDLGYAFDAYGNLTAREDFAQEVRESFTYDTLNRLTGSTLRNAQTNAALSSKSYRYDAVGNIVNKSDVGAADYVYGAGSAGPHAVTSAGGNSYAYDASGNMVSGGGRTLTWTSFQKPLAIARGSATSTFEYGPERARIRQVKVKGAATETVTYVGGLYERVEKTGSATEHVHYVFAGGMRIAVETASEAAGSSAELRYLHQDHLGSVDVVTDESGAVVERLSFGAFGERRVAQGSTAWRDSALALSSAETRRGFTDHEQLDDFGLVHMNGRVYDPALGRFLSADPFVQFALSSQGYNRYTYANNNPLSFTDPSGYFIKKWVKKAFRGAKKVVRKALSNKVVRIAATVVFAVHGAPDLAGLLGFTKGSIGAGVVGGFGSGLIASGGDLKAAFVGGLTGGAFGWVGGSGLSTAGRVAAHGVVGGVSSELMGGKFGPGFFSAGFSKLVTPGVSNAIGDNVIAKTVAMATVGGTASEIAGGKFANGAATAAFGYLYNELSQEEIDKRIFSNSSIVGGRHEYQIFGMVCDGGPGCNQELAIRVNKFSDGRDVPFSSADVGSGIKSLMGFPIYHQELPDELMSINHTLPGHPLDPGSVTLGNHWLTGHVVYNRAPLFYGVTGKGDGPFPRANNYLGLKIFRSNVEDVLREFGR